MANIIVYVCVCTLCLRAKNGKQKEMEMKSNAFIGTINFSGLRENIEGKKIGHRNIHIHGGLNNSVVGTSIIHNCLSSYLAPA